MQIGDYQIIRDLLGMSLNTIPQPKENDAKKKPFRKKEEYELIICINALVNKT